MERIPKAAKTITIIGPFATEYSLAKVNRNLAIALNRLPDINARLWADEATTDRLPGKKDFEKYPELKELAPEKRPLADVEIFNNYPKSSSGKLGLDIMKAPLKLGYLAWEETVIPEKWIAECNSYLHAMLVPSAHVKTVFRNCGLKIPIINISEGVALTESPSEKFTFATKKRFKFLHVSSAQPRKGVDVLLKAYFSEFTNKDECVLILKLYRNPENPVPQLLKELKRADAPEVLVINDTELTDAQMKSITDQADAAVYPSRAEGFALPVAEAMALGVPVITTGYSGQMDFCTNENSFLLDYRITDATASHLMLPGSKWAEPDMRQLKKLMRYLYKNRNSAEVKKKIAEAKKSAHYLTWENTALKLQNLLNNSETLPELKNKKLAVVTTMNTKCGIAEYSCKFYPLIESVFKDVKYLANTDAGDRVAPDNSQVERTWEYGEQDFTSTIAFLKKYKPDFLHIQYNHPFYSLSSLAKLIEQANCLNIKVLLTLHSVQVKNADYEGILSQLNLCAKVFVHNQHDAGFLTDKGLRNVVFEAHGVSDLSETDRFLLRKKLQVNNNPVIATHGLIHNKRGLLETIEAVNILKQKYPGILLLAVNAVNPNNSSSSATHLRMQQLIHKLKLEKNVLMFDEFLEVAEINKLLQLADLIIFAYAELEESASGAVTTAMGAKRPVVVSRSHIFRDLEVGYRIDDNSPKTIADAVERLLSSASLYKQEVAKIKKFAAKFSWEAMTLNYVKGLEAGQHPQF